MGGGRPMEIILAECFYTWPRFHMPSASQHRSGGRKLVVLLRGEGPPQATLWCSSFTFTGTVSMKSRSECAAFAPGDFTLTSEGWESCSYLGAGERRAAANQATSVRDSGPANADALLSSDLSNRGLRAYLQEQFRLLPDNVASLLSILLQHSVCS